MKHENFVSPVKGAAYNSTLAVLVTVIPDRARLFMAQWYAFSASIPAFLSLCAWKAGTELERRNIIINLYSELGLDSNDGTCRGYRDILVRAGEAAGFPTPYIEKLKALPIASGFSMDHGFRLSNATKRRPFAKQLYNAYRIHDNLREKLCQKLP